MNRRAEIRPRVAGGPKLETERDALELTYESLQRGAIGVDMGRSIWQAKHAVALIRAIRHIVHEDGTRPTSCSGS